MTVWGVHNRDLGDQLVTGGFISVGWELKDLRSIGNDRERIRAALRENLPEAKEGSIRVWSEILLRFAFEMEPGDLVVSPNKTNRTLNFGRITGDYGYYPHESRHQHRRTVEWILTDVPRDRFSESERREVSQRQTVFKINKSAAEFSRLVKECAN